MSDLAARSCVPCRGGVPPMGVPESNALLTQLEPGWEIAERTDAKRGTIRLLRRAYALPDFAAALAAANRVGAIAEREQHHPDLHVAWGRLIVEIWTHKIGGLTESDFVFAAKCDA